MDNRYKVLNSYSSVFSNDKRYIYSYGGIWEIDFSSYKVKCIKNIDYLDKDEFASYDGCIKAGDNYILYPNWRGSNILVYDSIRDTFVRIPLENRTSCKMLEKWWLFTSCYITGKYVYLLGYI